MYQICDAIETACKVLVIDDSDADRLTYRRYLDQSGLVGCSILESDCGEEGLDVCLQNSPDVILLDYRLPDMDGLEFLQMLQTDIQPMPAVIMLTGQGSERIAVEAMKMGAQDYLVKGSLKTESLTQAIFRALSRQRLQQQIARQQRQQQLMAEVAIRISQSRDFTTILEATVDGTRQLLDCDRTVIYRFESDLTGTILAESVLPSWRQSRGTKIEDTCFQTQGADRYLQGHKTIIADIYDSDLTPCHIQLLEQFQVRANIVVPILLHNATAAEPSKLWGLFIAHHCRGPRNWQEKELALLDDLSVQLAIALQQNELIATLQKRANTLVALNHRLVKITKALETRNQELDKFAYVASHDLKAPLRAVANLATWLQEDLGDQVPPENQRQLELMQSRVHRMEGFIEGLLMYSRAGRKSLEAVAVNTQSLVHDVVTSIVKPPMLRIDVPPTMPTIQTQKLLLEQVFANLISNAVKYHDRPDGTVSVAVEDQGEFVEFAIADDGPGIDPRYHDRIFGIFQTLNSRDDVESTGIGLSIVKKLIEQQGGNITVKSALGEGSTFAFTWPKHSA